MHGSVFRNRVGKMYFNQICHRIVESIYFTSCTAADCSTFRYGSYSFIQCIAFVVWLYIQNAAICNRVKTFYVVLNMQQFTQPEANILVIGKLWINEHTKASNVFIFHSHGLFWIVWNCQQNERNSILFKKMRKTTNGDHVSSICRNFIHHIVDDCPLSEIRHWIV